MGTLAGGAVTAPVVGTGSRGTRASSNTILGGTKHETEMYVREGGKGPTALVVGGIHGDEKSGYRAASEIAEWEIEGGTLVVLPKANQVAIRHDRREGANGDLNRMFPTGEKPESKLARAIWDVVSRHEPDVVLDLHRSLGIYGYHESSVGQVIWPTDVGGASEYAKQTAERVNDDVVPWHMPYHAYRRGGELDGSRPMLIHKVAGDLGKPGYIVETTKFLLDSQTRTRWTKRVARELLSRHGIERRTNR